MEESEAIRGGGRLWDVRLNGLANGVEDVLNLARLLPNCVERARIRGLGPGTTKRVLATELVASSSSDLGHAEN